MRFQVEGRGGGYLQTAAQIGQGKGLSPGEGALGEDTAKLVIEF